MNFPGMPAPPAATQQTADQSDADRVARYLKVQSMWKDIADAARIADAFARLDYALSRIQ